VARFEFEVKGKILPPATFLTTSILGDPLVLSLPDAHAPLGEQRAAARSIRTLFPDAEMTVYSCTDLPDGSVVRRTMKEEVRKRKHEEDTVLDLSHPYTPD
jgi:hypothetical protein